MKQQRKHHSAEEKVALGLGADSHLKRGSSLKYCVITSYSIHYTKLYDGVGISAADVRQFKLPLPVRDMLPITIEEKIICYADKFYSKNGNGKKAAEKTVGNIVSNLKRYGPDKIKRFQSWVEMFEY